RVGAAELRHALARAGLVDQDLLPVRVQGKVTVRVIVDERAHVSQVTVVDLGPPPVCPLREDLLPRGPVPRPRPGPPARLPTARRHTPPRDSWKSSSGLPRPPGLPESCRSPAPPPPDWPGPASSQCTRRSASRPRAAPPGGWRPSRRSGTDTSPRPCPPPRRAPPRSAPSDRRAGVDRGGVGWPP